MLSESQKILALSICSIIGLSLIVGAYSLMIYYENHDNYVEEYAQLEKCSNHHCQHVELDKKLDIIISMLEEKNAK